MNFNKHNKSTLPKILMAIGCLCFIFFTPHIYAQKNINLKKMNALQATIDSGLKYIIQTQNANTIANKQFEGEWPCTMQLRTRFFLLGKNKAYQDANCFTVAAIHNILAQLYLQDKKYAYLNATIENAFTRIMSYKNSSAFNFWNALPPNITLKKRDVLNTKKLVRRPNNYKLKGKFMNNAANIAEDADDTGLALSAVALRKKIFLARNDKDTLHFNMDNTVSLFEKYRDTARQNRHWYNIINHNEHNTGAYLTWLAPEHQFKNWNLLKGFLHNAFFYNKHSICYPKTYEPYIPYGTNDLDAVVNANVLTTLCLLQKKDAQGASNAMEYIEKKCKQKSYNKVGIYYPNNYAFPYAVAKAYNAGILELQNASTYVVTNILQTQKKDGSWSSRKIVNHKDQLQSTIYATNALLLFGDFETRKSWTAIEKGIAYILQNAISDSLGIHWQGGVFFSGGTVVRNTLFWKSDAYTSALALMALVNYKAAIEVVNR